MKIPERIVPDNSDEFKEHLSRYEFASRYSENKIICSMACGEGFGEYLLVDKGKAKKVIGVDNNREAINRAREKYKLENIEFKCEDILNNSFGSDYFDLVISFETIEHIEDDNGFLKEINRILKPGGTLILSTPNKASSYRDLFAKKPYNPFHVREYKRRQLNKLLTKYFSDLKYFGQKEILKRSVFMLPKYIYYKVSKKINKIELKNIKVIEYPTNSKRDMCYFVVVCEK
ncbi:MAG: class I SAM-dependent methyltransferase [bacterium]